MAINLTMDPRLNRKPISYVYSKSSSPWYLVSIRCKACRFPSEVTTARMTLILLGATMRMARQFMSRAYYSNRYKHRLLNTWAAAFLLIRECSSSRVSRQRTALVSSNSSKRCQRLRRAGFNGRRIWLALLSELASTDWLCVVTRLMRACSKNITSMV